MGNYIGGDLFEAVCSHPTLGVFYFSPKSNESFTIDKGGLRSNDDANGITSKGQIIDQLNVVRWSVEGPLAVDFNSGNEIDGLAALAADPLPGVWTFSLISGAILKGVGKPVGDQNSDSNTAQQTLKVSGGGTLEII